MKCAFLLSLLFVGSSAAGLRNAHSKGKIMGAGKSKLSDPDDTEKPDDYVITGKDIEVVENVVLAAFQKDEGKANQARAFLVALGDTLGLNLEDANDAMDAFDASGLSMKELKAMFEKLKGSTIGQAKILIRTAEQQVPVIVTTDKGFAPVHMMNATARMGSGKASGDILCGDNTLAKRATGNPYSNCPCGTGGGAPACPEPVIVTTDKGFAPVHTMKGVPATMGSGKASGDILCGDNTLAKRATGNPYSNCPCGTGSGAPACPEPAPAVPTMKETATDQNFGTVKRPVLEAIMPKDI